MQIGERRVACETDAVCYMARTLVEDIMAKIKKAKRIPKRIGGVKLPKQLRKRGEALIDRVGSVEAQAAIAKGLTIAAGLANLAAERTRQAKSAANDPAPPPPLDPVKVASAVSTVANEVLGRLFAGRKG